MPERIISDLRERRLWPVAVVLLVAIVVVPFVLARSPAAIPPAPAPVAAAATSLRASLPSVSVSQTPSRANLNAKPRNPFTPSTRPKALTSAIAAKPVSTTTSAMSSSRVSQGVSPGSGGGTPHSSPGPRVPVSHGQPAPSGLTSKQTYEVTLATTQPNGGLDTTPSVERLSPVPSPDRPLLIELGVLEGGQRVLFAVLQGTNVSGPGSCIPGPVDCELLSLGVNQTETVSGQGDAASAATSFAVTAISVADHPSAAAAQLARHASSPEGLSLLTIARLDALSLFSYQPSRGVVVDLRNLSAGGN